MRSSSGTSFRARGYAAPPWPVASQALFNQSTRIQQDPSLGSFPEIRHPGVDLGFSRSHPCFFGRPGDQALVDQVLEDFGPEAFVQLAAQFDRRDALGVDPGDRTVPVPGQGCASSTDAQGQDQHDQQILAVQSLPPEKGVPRFGEVGPSPASRNPTGLGKVPPDDPCVPRTRPGLLPGRPESGNRRGRLSGRNLEHSCESVEPLPGRPLPVTTQGVVRTCRSSGLSPWPALPDDGTGPRLPGISSSLR